MSNEGVVSVIWAGGGIGRRNPGWLRSLARAVQVQILPCLLLYLEVEMRGVKVLKYLSPGKYRSAAAPASAIVEYWANEWTIPREFCGPLAVFENLEDARYFVTYDLFKCESELDILPCEYDPSEELYMNCRWDKLRLQDAPKGTRLASAVKILEV